MTFTLSSTGNLLSPFYRLQNLKPIFGRLRKWMYDFGRFCVRYGRKNILAETAQKRVYATLISSPYENFISDKTEIAKKKVVLYPLFCFSKIRGCETFF